MRAVDRWIVRHPGHARACPVPSVPPSPRAATYAVDSSPGSSSQAWLALPLAAGDASTRLDAEWIAAALDGADGLLERALNGGLARGSWSARPVGGGARHGTGHPDGFRRGALDAAAVRQVRGDSLDRLRQGSLAAADVAHATTILADRDLAASLDPGRRVLALWRSAAQGTDAPPAPPPTLDALRAFAAATLHDDALIIVAVRPPRPPSPKPS